MYKLVFVCLALLAVASAQFIASPYSAYSGLYRSGYYGATAYPYAYSAGYVAPSAYSAYPGYANAAYLYK